MSAAHSTTDRASGRNPDVLVVGGGIIGYTAAWRVLAAGGTVTVLDPTPGDGATRAAAGMLAPVTEADFGEERLLRLNLASAALWPAFAAVLESASSLPVGLRETGTLTLAYDTDDIALGHRLLALHHRWGLGSEEIGAAGARLREPLVSARISGAFFAPGDHQVDPRATHAALAHVLAQDARAVVVHRAAARLLRAGGTSGTEGAVVGALDDAGRTHRAGLVVVAAGSRSGELLADVPEVNVPTRPVTGQTLRLEAPAWFTLDHVVRGLVQGRPIYLVPRAAGPDGRREVVVGATSEEGPDDRRATAGGVFAILRDARALVPGIDELALVEATPRARPATPDNLPVIGPTSVPGLVLATGHYRNGILLTPITAAAIDAILAGRPLPPEVAAIDPMRFAPLSAGARLPARHHTHDSPTAGGRA